MVRVAALASLVLCVPYPAAATILPNWNLDEMIRRSDLIVVGTVGADRTVRDGRQLLTETSINVERTLLGVSRPTIVISQMGGRDGVRVSGALGDARLIRGHRVLLFTFAAQDGRRFLVGMGLGAYEMSTDRGEQILDVPLVAPGQTITPPVQRRIAIRDVIRAIGRVRP